MTLSVAMVAHEKEDAIREQLKRVGKELHPSVAEDEEIIRRALFALRNQAVVFHRYLSLFSVMMATVRDVRDAEVTIDFRNNTIDCSCPQEGWCRHKVSALLSLYQHLDSVQDWVRQWRSKKSADLQSLAAVRTPGNWLKMVDEVLAYYLEEDEEIPGFLYETIAENALEKLRKHLPFEREWQPVYRLFMELAITYQISLRVSQATAVDAHLFQAFLQNRFHSFQNTVHEIPASSRLFATDPFFDRMQVMLREMLFEHDGFFSRKMNVYLLFWDSVFTEKRRALEELVHLQERQGMKFPEVLNVFYIILKNYAALEENMRQINPEHVDIYLGLVKFAFSKRNGQAAEIILRRILPYLKKFIQSVNRIHRSSMIYSISSLYENITLSEEEEILLYSAFGKDGVAQYSKHLLAHKRYEEWVALHQMYPTSIGHLEYCGLKQVAEEAPALVLPLYHFYAMEEIRQKSRMNYKEAVRIWKKMKAAAKKAGKMRFWEEYIGAVREQNKRLRALQEELEKGNLFG
ncbi:SWIM zinc finger family protein [Ureibacillus terrenus]|uniref:SWIM-type domain-containing protein n=1 Tax=Ureibacillus terrenus TaxID=118246 RepID=A0A540V2G5_9BACL|nr:SWIM zinc finger family protein [Ureibacillus terrenus]MED3662620.1 SWIM zinc finger family protein [Ureibacillus terrenus]MED3764586.1 SWIM zinc finger family protein [Ureibacillus terrenus]TQE90921.1 hypothetical protein FKZ59_07910 [Ureibacillus terrenus]